MAATDLASKVDALERAIGPLERSFDRIEIFLLVATALVVVGLVIEYWDDAHRIIERIRTKRPIPRHLAFAAVGAIMVTAGVAWELVEEIQAARVESDMRTDSDGVIALLTSTTSNSVAMIAQADARAHEADEKAEAEKLERVKLEKQLEPRRLNLDQIASLEAALKPFAGKNVVVESYALDVDSALLGTQLINAFGSAHLVPTDLLMTVSGLGGIAWGVHISGKNEDLGIKIAEILANADGIKASFDSGPVKITGITMGNPNHPEADVTVFVGVKPLPY